MFWALPVVLLDQLLATLAVSHGWAHPHEVRLLYGIPYETQLLLGFFLLAGLWCFKSIPYALIAGGWLSNALSFARFHFVPDYLTFHLGEKLVYNNGADLFISVGAIWLIISLLITRGRP